MNEQPTSSGSYRRLPPWLKRPAGGGVQFPRVINLLKDLHLATVCNSAACPNRGECFSRGTATFMIMGEHCTRNCRFCAVAHGNPTPLEEDEPERLAQAVNRLGLKHVVLTSVTRDDLPDGGAGHFARCIEAIRCFVSQAACLRYENPTKQEAEAEDSRAGCPRHVTIEVLTPDFQGDPACLDVVYRARPDVFNHNVETTRRLTPEIRSGADYERSLGVLRYMADKPDHPIVKSGFMLGLGENEAEIDELLADLRAAGVEMLTIGQYLRPTKDNREVAKYYHPDEFAAIQARAEKLGFAHVAAGPFVRSSYLAEVGLASTVQTTKKKMPLRFMIDPPQSGVTNMAVDYALLHAVNEGRSPAALRFYQWDEPTISLGYFQKYEEAGLQDAPIAAMPVVRRQTGGGAILHNDELTYSLVLPLDEELPFTDIEAMYRLVHDAFIEALTALGVQADYRGGRDNGNSRQGPFFCFARLHRLDLVAGGAKLLGSAQRRIKNAVLQHGSLILGRHFDQQPSSAVHELAGRPINLNELMHGVADIIAAKLGMALQTAGLNDAELAALPAARAQFASESWNRQR